MSPGTGKQTGAAAPAHERVRERPRIGFGLVALHLGALWAFAFVQPLFDLLGRQAEFFVARANTPTDIVVFAVAFTFLPPLAMTLAVWAAGRVRPSLGQALLVLLVAGLAAAVVLSPLGGLLGGSALAIIPALAVGVALAALYARAAGLRAFMTVLSPAPLLFLALFLFASPISKLVFPEEAGVVSGAVVRSQTPVVVVVLDELPTTTIEGDDGRIDERLFPSLAALARDATWYRNATTVADSTTASLATLLSAEAPEKRVLPTFADHPRNLFTLLGRSHRLGVIEPNTNLCPERLCGRESRPPAGDRLRGLVSDARVVSLHLLLPGDLRDGLPPIDRAWEGFDVEKPRGAQLAERHTREDVAGFMRDPRQGFEKLARVARRPSARPPFLFIHAPLPHVPWKFLPSGQQYFADPEALPGLIDDRWVDQSLADQGFQRHLAQAQYADRLVGQLLRALRAGGRYDDALVIVTADHGASFREGGFRRAVTGANFAEIAGVPLLVKRPRQRRGSTDERAARTIDILPTVARQLGVRNAWPVDGRPVATRPVDPGTRLAVRHWTERIETRSLAAFRAGYEERERYEASLLKPETFDWAGIYGIGPASELVGRRVAGLDVLPAGSARGTLDDPDALSNVVPDYATSPAWISGQVTGLDPGNVLVLGLNGRIEATTRAYREGGSTVFTALVSPDSFKPGPNEMVVYELAGEGRLRGLGRTPLSYELVLHEGREALVRGGERVPIVEGGAGGYVERVFDEGKAVRVRGWAASPAYDALPDRLVAVVGRRVVGTTTPGLPRGDVGDRYPGLGEAGYQLVLPRAALAKSNGDLRILAVVAGRAGELRHHVKARTDLASFKR